MLYYSAKAQEKQGVLVFFGGKGGEVLDQTKKNPPVTISASIENLIIRAMETNFVPITDDRGMFIGIVTRRSIIKHFYEKNIFPQD